jgi:hypothetical protein
MQAAALRQLRGLLPAAGKAGAGNPSSWAA